MEVEWFFFLCMEELEYLYEYLSYLGIEFDVVFGFFANFLREQLQAVFYLVVALWL